MTSDWQTAGMDPTRVGVDFAVLADAAHAMAARGRRAAAEGDVWGTTMRVNSLALTDQAMQDVIAYVQTLR